MSITAGPDGALWFTEYGSNKIGRITTAGVITEYTIPTPSSQPTSITPGPDGALWFTEYGSNKIGRITTAGVITEYATPPPGSFNDGVFITPGPDGALWFTTVIGNVGRVTTGGAITVPFHASGSPNGISAGGITAGPDGALWFAWAMLPNSGEIGRITTTGAITEYATKNRPDVITTGPDGALWFTESILPVGGKIGRITTAGAITEYDIPTSGPFGITAAPDGALWFTEAGKIGRITTDGMITEYTIPTPGSQPMSITAGPDGALWFTDTHSPLGADKIGRVLLPLAPPAGFTFAGSMAQLASGGGWDTTLTLVNTGAAAGEVLLNFFGNEGSPLQLPFSFPQASSSVGPLVASTLDRTLNANSLLVMDSQQPSNPNAQVGSAQLFTHGNVSGFAIFKYLPSGQEAVVPLETRSGPSYVLAFDNTGVLATGVALANVGTQTANIPVVIRDDTSAQIGTDTISLTAQGHTSFLLTTNYAATTGKRGTIEFDTPPSGQITALGLRANGSTLTTLPVFADITPGGGSMAQVASGGGWQTTFTLVNTGTSSAQAQLSFFDNNGNPLSLPLTLVQSGTKSTASTLTQTITAGATLLVLTQGTNVGASVVGSALLTTSGNIGGFAIFHYDPTGQEAVVPLETRKANAYLLAFDNTNGLTTGVALANVSNQAANVPVVLRDDTGASLGTSMINLDAHGHTSFILTSSSPSVAGKRGTIEFDTTAAAQISALGLRATPNGAVTTLPVLVK